MRRQTDEFLFHLTMRHQNLIDSSLYIKLVFLSVGSQTISLVSQCEHRRPTAAAATFGIVIAAR